MVVASARHVKPKKGDAVLLAGTLEGAFFVRAGAGLGGTWPARTSVARRSRRPGRRWRPRWTRCGRRARRLRDRVVTEQGEVRPHGGVEGIRFTGGLATPLPGSAESWILPGVSGG